MSQELKKRVLSSLLLFPVIWIIIIKGSIFFNLFLIISLIIALYEWYSMSKKKIYYYFGVFFLIFSFYTIYKVYNFNDSYLNFLFIFLTCIATDIGGYIFGKLLKGPRLVSISPNKTYSGVIGGYIFSIMLLTIFLNQTYFSFEKLDNLYITYIMIFIISSISQLGDIFVSYFKRLSNVKDTGKLIPGHGGLLDRADGMIFAYPIYYLMLLANLKLF
jgi:phosphatidate cytidylyltransferase|tara:strand:+ start:678 stop:1328 length:651 start_codon:yes stop_codon:yes gene_type:complete